MRKVQILILLLLFSSSSYSHQDRIIRLDQNGTLNGLPDEYLPASIDLPKLSISIASTKVTLPSCISDYFGTSNYTLDQISSSWYHERSLLPPYINFNFKVDDSNIEYDLLFSLDDLSLLEMTKITQPDPNTWQRQDIDLDQKCLTMLQGSYAIQ